MPIKKNWNNNSEAGELFYKISNLFTGVDRRTACIAIMLCLSDLLEGASDYEVERAEKICLDILELAPLTARRIH